MTSTKLVNTTILLLTAVAMVTSSPAPDVAAWFKFDRDLEDNAAAAAGAALRWNIIQNIRDYLCSIGSAACTGVKAYVLVHRLQKGDIKCADLPAPVEGVCGEVFQQLGSGFIGSTDEDIKNGLVKIGNMIMKDSFEDFNGIDIIRNAIINFICDSEGADVCDIWK